MENKNEEIFYKVIIYLILVVFPLAFAAFLWWPTEKEPTPQEKKYISEQKKFDSIISSPKFGQLIMQLKNNSLKVSKEKFGKIDEKFICIRINKHNNRIEPFLHLNENLKNQGYKVTFSTDSLRYAIIGKTIKVNVGNYTNGATAYKLQDNIIIYDFIKDKSYNVKNELGSDPPFQIRGENNGTSDFAVGSSWDDLQYLTESLKFIKK